MFFITKHKFNEVVEKRIHEEQDRLQLLDMYHSLQDQIIELNDKVFELESKIDTHYFPDITYTVKDSDFVSTRLVDEQGEYTTTYLNSLKNKRK